MNTHRKKHIYAFDTDTWCDEVSEESWTAFWNWPISSTNQCCLSSYFILVQESIIRGTTLQNNSLFLFPATKVYLKIDFCDRMKRKKITLPWFVIATLNATWVIQRLNYRVTLNIYKRNCFYAAIRRVWHIQKGCPTNVKYLNVSMKSSLKRG